LRRLRLLDGTLAVSGPRSRPALLRHALQRFLMREAHAALGPWLARVASASGLAYERLQIRRQRTRWGSCSRSGTISLNACLLFQPPDVANYLLIHELAHTRHMNHSRRFWRLVESLEPRWRELDAALTRGWREVPAWAIG
jgi:predicted metal-dependent hydrolase